MKKPHRRKVVFWNFIIFVLLLSIIEIVLRINGYGPYDLTKIVNPIIKVKPGNRYFQKDSLLGYKNLVGKFTVRLKDTLNFVTCHNEDTHRITVSNDEGSLRGKPELWFFGGSYTHGWSINDEETFPWLVQSKLDQFKVENFGVIGYGTIHFYLQLKKALAEKRKPKLVVINHAFFHLERNLFLFERRRLLDRWSFLGPLQQPYAKVNILGNISLSETEYVYHPWSFSQYSALSRFIQIGFENFLDWVNRKHEVTIIEYLFKEIERLCRLHQVDLLITNLTEGGYPIEVFCKANQIKFADISIDLNKKENTNLPIDGHPSAIANELYADKLLLALDKILKND